MAGALEERRQRAHVVSPKDDIHIGCLRKNGRLVLLGKAAAHSNLHAGALSLQGGQVPEGSIELVIRVLTHRTGVDNHHVSQDARIRLKVPGGFKRTGHPLGIVDIHLAAKGAHLIGAPMGGIERGK